MTIIDVIGTQEHIEDLHKISRDLYIAAFKNKYPGAKTEIETGYTDRITRETTDLMWQLAVDDKTHHSDRFVDYIEHPDYPITNLCLMSYDDTKEGDDLNPAFYYNPTARLANRAHFSLTNNTRTESKDQGFFVEGDAI